VFVTQILGEMGEERPNISEHPFNKAST